MVSFTNFDVVFWAISAGIIAGAILSSTIADLCTEKGRQELRGKYRRRGSVLSTLLIFLAAVEYGTWTVFFGLPLTPHVFTFFLIFGFLLNGWIRLAERK